MQWQASLQTRFCHAIYPGTIRGILTRQNERSENCIFLGSIDCGESYSIEAEISSVLDEIQGIVGKSMPLELKTDH
jgi:hypothetical protein